MTPEEMAGARFHLADPPGSVGEYLATPSGIPPIRSWAGVSVMVAALLFAIAGVIWLFGGSVEVGIGLAELHTADLSGWMVPLVVGGVAFLVVAGVLVVIARFGPIPDVDLLAEAKKAALTMMSELPRFGIGRQTPMRSVGLRARYVHGCAYQAVCVWARRYRFSDDDFSGARAAQYGGVDILVSHGRLYVFASDEAKRKYLERGNNG